MKYKKDPNDSLSKIEENLLTQSDNHLHESYENMHKQLINDYIFENTRSINTLLVEDINSKRFKQEDESEIENIEPVEETNKDILSTRYNRSKYSASFIDNESHRNENNLERFYEQKQSKIEAIITKRSNSTKRTRCKEGDSSVNVSRSGARPKTQNVNTKSINPTNSHKCLVNESKLSEKAQTITYEDFKAGEKDPKKINIKLRITNNNIEEILDIKDLTVSDCQKRSNMFSRNSNNFRTSNKKISPNKNATIVIDSMVKSIIKISHNQPKPIKYNKTEPEIKGI
jgi:hypothetical protein